jgi:hypothetical protein
VFRELRKIFGTKWDGEKCIMRSFFICSFHQYVLIKDEVVVASRMDSKCEKCMRSFGQKMKERARLQNVNTLGRPKHRWEAIKINREWEWTAFIWLRTGVSGLL